MILLLLALAVPNLDGEVRLHGRDSLAHACPLAKDRAITNAHVANSAHVWSVGEVSGVVDSADRPSHFRDLAWVSPKLGQFPVTFQVSQSGPKVGDTLYFVGYDWTSQDKALAPRVFKVKVIRSVAGHIAYKPAGSPGSSGSCVLNEKGEVVAVNKGAIELEDKARIGVGVAIWGSWLQLGEVRAEK
jgi:S1-C subfamily serine protease